MYYVQPGTWLWYKNKHTGIVDAVQVESAGPNWFYVRYNGKTYSQPYEKLGKVFFFSPRNAADPSAILEPPDYPAGRAPKYSDWEIERLSESDEYYREQLIEQEQEIAKK